MQNVNKFLLLSFGLFGFSALIFQVVFAKKLVLLFGLTAPAIATVLAVYFSGLALGSILFGRLADRFEDKIDRFYVSFFLLTGVYGLLTPLIFQFLNVLIKAVNNIYPLSFSGFNFFSFIFAFIFLIFPAILIGGGFPVFNKIFIRKAENIGKKVSVVYFVEVLGSALGVALAGFWLIPAFGNNMTIFLAAGVNIVVGIFLFYLFRSLKYAKTQIIADSGPINADTDEENISVNQQLHQRKSVANSTIQNPLFLYVLFATGFLALALEVLYTKTLILFIGSSTYAFSLILITFLLGIAFGSWALSFFADRIKRGYAYFGVFLGLIGFWLFITARVFNELPFWYLNIFRSFESLDFSTILFSQFALTFLVIFPATFLMGIMFPLGIKLAVPDIQKLGQGIGKLYFANTSGGVLGSLTAGFLLLPLFGYQKTLLVILSVYFLLGIFFLVKEKEINILIKGITIFFFAFWLAFGFILPPFQKGYLALGVFPYADQYLNLSNDTLKEAVLKTTDILFYSEGLSNIVVFQRGGERLLRINGKTDASNGLNDLEAQILIGALPMLFHQDPKDVLVVGLGAGITLGSVAQFDSAEKIDVVEIDPAIVKAADYFKAYNHDVLNDPRVEILVADARNYLMLSDKKYDVISSEPSNIWVSGNANLFTKEYYELAKNRLNKNGVMLQWLHAYSLGLEDLKTVIKTFTAVFPNSFLFQSASGGGDLFMVGSPDDLIFDLDMLMEKFNDPTIQEELGRIYLFDPYDLLTYFVADGAGLKEFSDGARIHSDQKSTLEFSAPKTLYQETMTRNTNAIGALYERIDPTPVISGGDKEKIKQFRSFTEKLFPVKAAIAADDPLAGVKAYISAREEGLSQYLIEAYLIRACDRLFQTVRLFRGEEEASIVMEECSKGFNEIVVGE